MFVSDGHVCLYTKAIQQDHMNLSHIPVSMVTSGYLSQESQQIKQVCILMPLDDCCYEPLFLATQVLSLVLEPAGAHKTLVCVCVRMHVFLCIRACMFVCACMCVCACVHVCVSVWT